LFQQVGNLGQRDSAVEHVGNTGPARLARANGQVKEAGTEHKRYNK